MSARGGRGIVLVAASIAVAVAIVGGLIATGSPGEARKRRFDERRVDDLRNIAAAVDRYKYDHGTLPASLEDVKQASRWTISFEDPERHTPYGYRSIGEKTYELCATYSYELAENENLPYEKQWAHPAGKHCHRLTVNRIPPDGPPVPSPGYRGGP